MPFKKHIALALLTGLSGIATMRAAAQTFTAPTVATSSQTTVYSNGNASLAIAADAAGNLFFTRPGEGSFVEDPAGGGAQITLIKGSLSYPKGVAVDNAGFAYTSDYSGHLWQVPAGGGTAVDLLPACNLLDGYYLGTQVVAVDGARNVYTAGNNETMLFKITQAGVCSVVAGVTLDANSHISVDTAGDLAYSTGGKLYSLPVGASASVAVARTFDAINGLRSDAVGNVFVTTNSTVTELPFLSGALSGAQAFIVLPYSSAYDIGIAPNGSLYTTSDGTNILRNLSGSLPFSATAVGTTSASQTATVVFNSAQTLTAIRFASGSGTSTELASTGTGTCAVGQAYAAGASCTLILTETPSSIGVRNGAVVLSSATGTIGSLLVAVQGSGGGLVADPGTQTTLGTGFTAPNGIAVGTSGGVVVSDKTAGTVSYFAPGGSTATTIATGLTQPAGVALAPDGTIYVANTGANTVLAIPYSGTAYGTAAIAVSGLNAPSAIALSNTGTLYIANTGGGTVLRVPNQGGFLNPAAKATLSQSFTAPSGLTFDASGDLFVADSTAGTVTEVTTAGTSSAIASGLTAVGALAVDDSGTLYVQQSGVTTILRIPFSNGAFNSNATTRLGTGLTAPASLAADSLGNLYVADSGAPAVVKLQRTAGTLSFGRVNVGAASASQSETLSNDGDLSTKFASPLYTTSGNTADFTISTSGTSACSAGGTLVSGTSCAVSGTFSPTATGTRTDTLIFTTNAAPITVAFTGTGVNLAATTLILTQVSPTGSATFGQAVMVTATVKATSGTPTGTVQFAVNGVNTGTAVALTNGAASITLTGLASGTNTVTATYSGDNTFASSTGTALSVVVVPATTTTTLASSIAASTPVPPGTSVTLTAAIGSTITTPKPTGTVTFTTGTTVLGTAALSPTGIATLTSATLPTGTYTIVATYSGDTGFAGSTSNSVAVAILAPQYILSNTPTALTVTAPGTVSTTFLVTPISGYTGGVDMSCSGLPSNAQCSFTPAVVYFGTTATPAQTVTLAIVTNTPAPTTVASWMLPFGGLLLLSTYGLRRKLAAHGLVRAFVLLFACATALAGLSGCGSTTSVTPTGTSNITVNFIGTPSGTATVPTSGTGNIPKSFTVSLTVK